MPQNAGEGGQNPSLSSRERQGRTSTAACTALAFPFPWVSSYRVLGPRREAQRELGLSSGPHCCSRCGQETRWGETLCAGGPAEPPTAQVYLINWRGLGCPDCSSSSPNKRSRQDLRPSKKTSCPRSLAAVRLIPSREQNIMLQSETASEEWCKQNQADRQPIFIRSYLNVLIKSMPQ